MELQHHIFGSLLKKEKKNIGVEIYIKKNGDRLFHPIYQEALWHECAS